MARRRGTTLPLILALMLLAVAMMLLLAPATVPTPPLPQGANVQGTPLATEIQPREIVARFNIHIVPGSVYEITQDINGLRLAQKSSRLVETVRLENVDIAAGDVIAPHLYDWYFDGRDDQVVYDWVDAELPASGVYEWEVRNRVVGDGYGPDTSHGYWCLFLFRVSHDAIFSVTEEYGRNNYDFRYTVARINNRTAWEGVRALWPTSGDGYTRDVAYSWNAKHATARFSSGTLTLTYRVMHSGGVIEKSVTADVSSWTSIPFKHAIVGEATAPGYRKPQVMMSYAWLRHNGRYLLLLDPTFYNGSAYVDLVSGAIGIPYGGVVRIPAEQTWLWLVKGVENDGRLHLKFVPPGSVFRIRYNGLVYEWRVEGETNAAGLVEDYAIDIVSVFGTHALVGATVELVYPSPKIRVYAPAGFTIRIVGGGFSVERRAANGYVDFGLPEGVYEVQVLGRRVEPTVLISLDGEFVVFTVKGEHGQPLAALIALYRDGGVVVQGTANSNGEFRVQRNMLDGQLRIRVVKLENGVLYYLDRAVNLDAIGPATTTITATMTTTVTVSATPTATELSAQVQQQLQQVQQAQSGTLLLLLAIVLLIVVVVAITGPRR